MNISSPATQMMTRLRVYCTKSDSLYRNIIYMVRPSIWGLSATLQESWWYKVTTSRLPNCFTFTCVGSCWMYCGPEFVSANIWGGGVSTSHLPPVLRSNLPSPTVCGANLPPPTIFESPLPHPTNPTSMHLPQILRTYLQPPTSCHTPLTKT